MDIVSDRPPNKSHQANTQKPRLFQPLEVTGISSCHVASNTGSVVVCCPLDRLC